MRFAREALSPRCPDLLDVLRRREPFARHRVFCVVDAGLAAARPGVPARLEAYVRAHKGSLILAAAPLIVPGGEEAKTRPELCDWVRARLGAAGIGARGHAVILGGGALLDAAGFAAATLHGGVRVTRLPTTVSAQAAGGCWTDCALNSGGRPDWLRAPQTPFGVVIDPRLALSQPRRGRRAGVAEALGLAVAEDAGLFHFIAEHARALAGLERRSLDTVVRWSARLSRRRAAAGGADGRTAGFGRWAAYALLSRSGDELLFGEACALGAAVDALLSAVLAGLPAAPARAILQTLADLGLPLWHDALGEVDEDGTPSLARGLMESAEREGCAAAVPLLSALACPRAAESITAEAVAAALEALRRFSECG